MGGSWGISPHKLERLHRIAPRLAPRSSGQSLAEFALLVPVLAMIFLSIVQFAFIFAAQVGVTNALREAARLGAITTPTTTTGQATSNGQGVYNALTDPSTGLLRKNVMAYSPSNVVTAGTGDTMVCYRLGTDAAGKPFVQVKVDVSYVHPLFVPLIAPILSGLDGNPTDGGLRIGASEEMRVENDEIVPPYTGGLSATPTCYNP